jgi:hypothetical protein
VPPGQRRFRIATKHLQPLGEPGEIPASLQGPFNQEAQAGPKSFAGEHVHKGIPFRI